MTTIQKLRDLEMKKNGESQGPARVSRLTLGAWPSPYPRLSLAFALLVLIVASLGSGRAYAQESNAEAPTLTPSESASSSSSSSSESRRATSISTSEILSASDEAERAMRGFAKTIRVGDLVERIESSLPEVSAALDRQSERQATLLANPSLSDLVELEAEWQSLRGQLPVWRSDLTARNQEAEQILGRLEGMRSLWTETRGKAQADGAPAAIIERTDDVLGTLDEIAAQTKTRRASLLTLQTKVRALENRVNDAADNLEELRGYLVRRVFERDREPIWHPDLQERLRTGLGERFAAALAQERKQFSQFLQTERDGIQLHVLLFVILAFLLRTARNRVRQRSEEEKGLSQVAEVFEFPLSVALLLAILFAPWLYDFIPPVVGQFLGAAALLPTVLILRRFSEKALLPILNALVVFYFVDRVRELTATLPTISRSIFVLEMIFAILFLGWLLRPSRLASVPSWAVRTTSLRVLGYVSRATFVLFCVALLAEILGFSRLGHLLGGGVLDSAYVGVVLYAAVRIFDSLVTFALRVKPLGLLKMVQRSRFKMRRRVRKAVNLVAVAAWAVTTLDRFAIWTPFLEGATTILTTEAKIGSIAFSLGDILAFVFTIAAAILLSRFIRFVLKEDVYPRMDLGRGVPYAISTFSHYAILLVGFVLAVAAMGIDLDRFTLLAGAFGVGIGFGLQNIVNNFVSGLILLSERPIQVGDTIEAGDTLGEVSRIGIRSSTVRTWSGAEMIVPNAQLISERVTNWTLSNRHRRIDLQIGVAYGTDRERVIEILSQVAVENPEIIDDPAPAPLFMGFGDSSLDFELRAWTGELTRIAAVRSNLALAVGQALDEAGIEIPFPQRDLHLKTVSEEVLPVLRNAREEEPNS